MCRQRRRPHPSLHAAVRRLCGGKPLPPPFSRSVSATALAAILYGGTLIRDAAATAARPAFSRRGVAAAVRREASPLPPPAVADSFGGCSARRRADLRRVGDGDGCSPWLFPTWRLRRGGKPFLPCSPAALLRRRGLTALFAILVLCGDGH